ncbi:hypothetical protein [Stenotrophomonas sp. SY1]|uniref:hypothetical protein n=1 Tax=Stenotrophomonas sp. SY1 TaxID=477235 RepID=UPI001E376AD3|nr:hypothetical protein [Stenotrophomonas sp. SY1]MCD9088306.1 hypothetical protein [Stenotrophomonas sp. SY1]
MDKNRFFPSTFSPPRRQRGIATVLIVLLVGLAVSVTVAATIYALRGTQSQQLTTHSATAAQAAAWRGVEALRLYLLQVEKTVWPGWVGTDAKPVSGMGALGVKQAVVTTVESAGSEHYRVTARVTGEAGVGSALTTATVEVIYDVAPGSGSPATPEICHSLPNAPMVFNGNLNYSGGSLEVVNPVDYENIVVAGDLTIGGGSSARISGCMKGNVSISGGGITNNGHIHSEGDIRINHMGNPSGTTLWGRNVDIGNGVSGGNYAAIKAGAYSAVVYSGGKAIGTAQVGGRLIDATVSGGIPWTRGTVVPFNSGRVVVSLDDGSRFVLDLGKLVIDPATGNVSGAAGAERLGDERDTGPEGAALPDVLAFESTSVTGGVVSLHTLWARQLWGQSVSILGWSGSYDTLWAGGHVDAVSGTVGELRVGGNMSAREVRVTGSGRVAGTLNSPIANVLAGQAGANPGLPGLPWCDARVKPVDANNYKGMANYLFESVNGLPQLTVQHVKRADGSSIDGVYPLRNPSPAQLALLQELMTCINGNDRGCLTTRKADGSWYLEGVRKMPAGVLWFDSKLTISGTTVDLLNTLVNKGGDVVLSSSGHLDLIAPNFAGASRVCGGDFYPTNLCASRSAFVTWEGTDAQGKTTTYTGLPIANAAVIAEEGATMAGWTLRGSVLLGKQLSTTGAVVTIHGSLTVGSNQRADTTISAGGISLEVPHGNGLNLLPVCGGGSPGLPAAPASAGVLWSRYL